MFKGFKEYRDIKDARTASQLMKGLKKVFPNSSNKRGTLLRSRMRRARFSMKSSKFYEEYASLRNIISGRIIRTQARIEQNISPEIIRDKRIYNKLKKNWDMEMTFTSIGHAQAHNWKVAMTNKETKEMPNSIRWLVHIG